MSFCTKSSNQGTFQRGDQVTHRRIRVNETNIVMKLFARISINQGPFSVECNQATKANFHVLKLLIPVSNGSTGLMKVATPY